MFLVNCFERFTMLCRCFLLSKTPQSFIIRLFFLSTFVRMFVHRFLVLKGKVLLHHFQPVCICGSFIPSIVRNLCLLYSSSSFIVFFAFLLFPLFIVFYFHRQQVSSMRFLLHGCFNPLSSPLHPLFISLHSLFAAVAVESCGWLFVSCFCSSGVRVNVCGTVAAGPVVSAMTRALSDFFST